ncbi:hypothetical protein KUL42_39320 [Alteromonas sp. KUL42]|uniref:hypothetical protein n=1 Tax=Alteromonas sp. KUL42 TaxID=2480797 RepID=UPI001035DD96|nr:hypothetical protein [Alteromonas sp. KUL42]TAP31736.1 hypothetical protein EYR97_19810 [Alteromonas sp. KUL42]GEA09171.1 hypothetical protein KUL42_39320 [Alteromonas sp. KUL42]
MTDRKDTNKDTLEDAVKYFKQLSHGFVVDSRHSSDCPILAVKAEAYELAAFHLERNVSSK